MGGCTGKRPNTKKQSEKQQDNEHQNHNQLNGCNVSDSESTEENIPKKRRAGSASLIEPMEPEIEILLLSNSAPCLTSFVNNLNSLKVIHRWPKQYDPGRRVLQKYQIKYGRNDNIFQFYVTPPCTKGDIRTNWEALPHCHCVIQLVDCRDVLILIM
eukprot:UN30197